MVSLAVVLYLFVRTLPRIDDREGEVPVIKTHWITVYLEKADQKLKYYSEKFLRRAGIVVLKISNAINSKLARLKKETEKEPVFITEAESDKNKEGNSV